jgi:hypothetical protein
VTVAGVAIPRWIPSPLRERRRRRRQEAKFERALEGLDAAACATIRLVRPYTMLGPEKLFALIEAVRHVCRHGIAGAIVECGVWRGGAVMAAARTALELGDATRRFYLYDTFTGMPAPGREDVALVGQGDPAELFASARDGEDASAWCRAGVEEVRANLARVGYGADRFVFVEGKVEDTIPRVLPGPIGLLRLDTDWYASTRHEMEHLMPLLVSGGVLIVDDYFRWAGNRQAVDEWLARHRLPLLLTKVGRSAIGVRP